MPLADILAAIAVQTIWGINFVAAKVAIGQIPPMLLMAVRFSIISVLVLPFVEAPKGRMLRVFALSTTFGICHFGLLFLAMRRIDVATAAIAIQVATPISALMAAIFFRDRLGWRGMAGMALGFAGIGLLYGDKAAVPDLAPLALILLSATSWAFANVQIKWLGAINAFSLNAWIAAFAVPQMLLVSWMFEEGQIAALAHADWRAWISTLYMAILSSLVAYGLWYYLLHKHPVNRVVPFNLLGPVVGVASGVAILGDALTWQEMLGGLLTILGVAVIVLRRPKVQTDRMET